jgi:pyruvate/2-oxoglutarate dehydrogenase complex dihydrolipoamide acyltransferase (E2) component
LISVHKISHAVEVLPICEEPAMISVHFTEPKADVIYNGTSTFDIAADINETGDAILLGKDSKLIKVAYISNLSVSYDIAKVDDLTAAKFIDKLSVYLHDPELLLL